VQDKEHILLHCPSADFKSAHAKLADLRAKHQHLFCSLVSGTTRLRDLDSQANTEGLELFVLECLDCYV